MNENIKMRLKMLEDSERKHDIYIKAHESRLDRHDEVYVQIRAALQPILDERQAENVTITIKREDAEKLRDGNPWEVPKSVRQICQAMLEEDA